MRRSLALLLAPALVTAGICHAEAPKIRIDGPWARATAPQQTEGAVYLSLTSPQGDRLTAIETGDADMAMLHQTVRHGSVSEMHDLDALDLPAGKKIVLSPQNTHIMLMGLKHRLVAGQTLMLSLTFEKAGTVQVVTPVARIGASGPPVTQALPKATQ